MQSNESDTESDLIWSNPVRPGYQIKLPEYIEYFSFIY